MDVRRFLADLERERAAADAALRLIGPGRRAEEVRDAAQAAREHLSSLGRLIEVRRLEDDMHRRHLLASVPAVVLAPWTAERLAAPEVDTGWVDAADDALRAAADAYAAAPLPGLAAALGAHLVTLRRRLGEVMAPGVRGRLTTVMGRTALVAGWSALGAGEQVAAREHFRTAEAAGSMGADRTLRAAALTGAATTLSSTYTGRSAASPGALDAAETAAAALPASAPGVIVAEVHGTLALELAAAGQTWEAHMDLAHGADRRPQAMGALAGLYHAGGEPRAFEAACLRRSGRHDQAAALTLADLATPAAGLPRRRARLLASLAESRLGAGDRDQATREAHAALDLAQPIGATVVTGRVRELAARLGDVELMARLR